FRDGLRVIGEQAFCECKALRSLAMPRTVTKLGSGAFSDCINLAKVEFNELGCRLNLAAVRFDEGALQIIGGGAFCGCKALQQETIPPSVITLGDEAFWGCRNLSIVQFSEGLDIIGEYAFYECTALRSVTVPLSVTKLGIFAFRGCTNLTEVILLGGDILLNQGFLDWGLFSGEGALNEKRFHETICVNAFHDCPLTTMKISFSERMSRLPQDCRPSIEGRIRDLRRLEITQDGTILACFPVIRRSFGCMHVKDTDNQTAESLHQVLRLISFHELKESSILIELAMWKSRLDENRARADCRTSVPDPAKTLIMEYCGFTRFLEPAIEGA
ncbi:hypothetical protein THAOC_24420, partial [Thalassiosira oceanica]